MQISVSDFAEKVGLTAVGDPPNYLSDRRGLADLIRHFVFCEGCVTRRELANFLSPIFQTLHEFDQNTRSTFVRVADELAELGDLRSIRVGREHGWTRTPFRWIETSPTTAVVLGHLEDVTTGIKPSTSETSSDLVRRFPKSAGESNIESFSSTNQVTIEEWIGDGGWNVHRERRGGHDSDSSINAFWQHLLGELAQSEAVAANDGSLRILSGPPGGRFGRHNDESPQGRWGTSLDHPDGNYLACYRARNDNDWRFQLIEIKDHRVDRALSLENADEFQWAVIARGVHRREPEQIICVDREVRLTFPPPRQLRGLLNLLGTQLSAWNWQLAHPVFIEQLQYWMNPMAAAVR
ncbi:hypothetical protein NHH03_12665 [Stieleria sp. TO1_6]|nr:hypothetical protein [Stieleria tagensis]